MHVQSIRILRMPVRPEWRDIIGAAIDAQLEIRRPMAVDSELEDSPEAGNDSAIVAELERLAREIECGSIVLVSEGTHPIEQSLAEVVASVTGEIAECPSEPDGFWDAVTAMDVLAWIRLAGMEVAR